MKTLLVDLTNWDLVLTADGDIAAATDPYAMAQDAASAVKLFKGELWYDTTKGIPYFGQILGRSPPVAFIKAQIVQAVLSVPGVTGAVCYLSSLTDRALTGQVLLTDENGGTSIANF